MYTDKTLNAKIKAYKEISAQITELEKEKKKLSDWIIAEYDNRSIDRYNGLGIVNQTRETIKKADVPLSIWDRFKTVSNYRYLRKCKA